MVLRASAGNLPEENTTKGYEQANGDSWPCFASIVFWPGQGDGTDETHGAAMDPSL